MMAAPSHMSHLVEADGFITGRCSCGAQGPSHVAGAVGESLAYRWAAGHAGIKSLREAARTMAKPVFAFELPRAEF